MSRLQYGTVEKWIFFPHWCSFLPLLTSHSTWQAWWIDSVYWNRYWFVLLAYCLDNSAGLLRRNRRFIHGTLLFQRKNPFNKKSFLFPLKAFKCVNVSLCVHVWPQTPPHTHTCTRQCWDIRGNQWWGRVVVNFQSLTSPVCVVELNSFLRELKSHFAPPWI